MTVPMDTLIYYVYAASAAVLLTAEVCEVGFVAFALASLPFMWVKNGAKKVNGHSDPLDGYCQAFGGVLQMAGAISYVGYGLYVWLALACLWAVAWVKAPRRKFPTGKYITKDADLSGKVAMITGPTSGIGAETARVLALRGAHVILVSRSEKKLQTTQKEILSSVPKATVDYLCCDLSSQESIRECVKAFQEMKLPLHLLINNAGLMALPSRRNTKEDLEMQVGVNHVGHFLLTTLLAPILEASGPSRVVCLSSLAYRYVNMKFLEDPKLETTPYDPWVAYGNAKMSNIMFAKEFNRRYSSRGITAYSVHPGGIFSGLQDSVATRTTFKWGVVAPFFFKSVEQGCATTLYCATSKDAEEHAGEYFSDCHKSKVKIDGYNDEHDKILWETTEKLI